MAETNKTTIGCGSIGGALLSAAIIMIRAFQTNAEPMSTWSAVSWIWMTMPWWLPTAVMAVFAVVALLGYACTSTRTRW